jgi:hypothetical protein
MGIFHKNAYLRIFSLRSVTLNVMETLCSHVWKKWDILKVFQELEEGGIKENDGSSKFN